MSYTLQSKRSAQSHEEYWDPPVGLAPAESAPEDVAAHCLRSTACRYALCGLSVNPASLIVRTTQRQAARGRAGMPGRTTSDPPPGNVA